VDDTGTDKDRQDQHDDPDGEDRPDEGAAEERDGPGDDAPRLDELDDRIQSARARAEDAVEGVEPVDKSAGGAGGNGETYADSGNDESAAEDDQTIAPPG